MTRHCTRHRTLVTTIALLAVAPVARAQVGTTPDHSPFRDLEKRQDVTLMFGPTFGGKDKVGAAPRGGSAIGVRYDVNLGASPLTFTGMIMRQGATRDILQPGLPLAQRIGRTVSEGLWSADIGLNLLLTGNRSWHSLVPSVMGGVGLVTNNAGITDSSNFSFGTRFSPVLGLGLKYAPQRSRWTVRADMVNHFYNVPYPQSFRDTTVGVPRITTDKGNWVRNTRLMVGITRMFGRR